ncbi:FAD-dependent oxidoreductase [Paenibacillus sp. PR3]|uniref:FAD-dependent oxidoreductase n=2 Tax=Paenibacillus terricola TaxID=2763503 RepID=A0ABR8MZE6_9BACL|nr:FAD-dependent oxidoreductase [Paenibacillus terricola]
MIVLSLLAVALLLSSSVTFSPRSEAAAAATSCTTPCQHYDVVVIGSELEGILLAQAAHKLGKSVLILDPRPKPGGQLIQGQMLVLDEPHDAKARSLVQGEMKRLFDGYNNKSIRTFAEFNQYYNGLIKSIPLESGITIQSIHSVQTTPKGSSRSIQSITYKSRDAKTHTVAASYWVENTDFAAIAGRLGLTRIPGTESLFKGGGPAPEYMAATYMLRFKNVNWNELHEATLRDYPLTKLAAKYGPGTYVDWNFGTGFSNLTAKFKPKDTQLKLRGINSTYQRDGRVIINALLIYDVNPSDDKSVQAAIKKAQDEAPRILEFLRKNIPGYSKAQLDTLPDYLYIREHDRYVSEYVLKRDDLMNSRMFWDNVSIGGYPIDVQGTRRFPYGQGLGKPDRYGLPLRSFEIKGIDNLLTAGKNVGAEAAAYGSVRIQPNTGLAAQVIGIIIGREKKPLRELDAADFKRIHQYLKKDYKIQVQA